MSTARVIEIFSSIQGEGIYVGSPPLFVRFWDCNLACHYCDTDYRGPYREYAEEELLREVKDRMGREGPHHAVSLTGGEPLLWWRFLKAWLPKVKALDQRTYLETNGTLPASLAEVLDWIDIVAMDIKPPSATADRDVWEAHEAFLRLAHTGTSDGNATGHRPEVFVKIVVTRQTREEELGRAFDLVSHVNPRIPVVLQPVTPFREVKESPEPEQLDGWRRQASDLLADVRIIPQVHRILGVP